MKLFAVVNKTAYKISNTTFKKYNQTENIFAKNISFHHNIERGLIKAIIRKS